MLGAREPGVRIAALIRNVPGELTKLTKAIFEAGGNIDALGTFLGESSENREVTIKVAGVDNRSLISVVTPLVERVVDSRELT
jgi:uncharacterized protein with ACT and thioredoxin-like domain